jgi:hypothetical protein
MNNPGRYLTLLPPINGADAISGSPYFTANPGDKAHMWDATGHFPLDAQTVHHLVGGGRIPPLRCSLLVGPRRHHASGRKYRLALAIRLRRGGSAGTNDLGDRHTRIAVDPAASGSRIFANQATVSAGVMVKF